MALNTGNFQSIGLEKFMMSEYSAPLQFIDLASQQVEIRDRLDAAPQFECVLRVEVAV